MLATKRSIGVTPEVYLREHVAHMPLPSTTRLPTLAFESQRNRQQKSKTGVSAAPQKRTHVLQNFKKIRLINLITCGQVS